MPCFPFFRSGDATDSYGYQLEFDPAAEPVRVNRSSKPYNWLIVTETKAQAHSGHSPFPSPICARSNGKTWMLHDFST
jgi:hypothetical protein